ncbi:MAG: universal stress protein [Syntrophomonas sp.]|nr:universal stress protein [Syntrophomonas sp.]
MYKKILLAVDGSATSIKAAQVANSYLEKGIAEELTILNVYMSNESSNYFIGKDISEKVIAAAKENGVSVLEKTKAVITSPNKVKTALKSGDIAQTIVKLGQKHDLIIMGSLGMNAIAGLLMGSVSSRVVQYADRPVLIVK